MSKMRKILMSSDPVSELRALSADELKSLEPAVGNLRMPIPRGYHHKDNLEHSLRVLGNAVEMEDTPDLITRTAALLHDIGKPATRSFEGKGKVTFRGHEIVGAKMSKKILPVHGYDPEETKKISLLIRLHMRSHGFDTKHWNDSAVRRLMTDARDQESFERLTTIFKADCTTKSEKKRQDRINNVDSLTMHAQKVRESDERKSLRPALNGNEVMEITSLTPGRELGAIMKFLNSDEGIALSREDALAYVMSVRN